MRGQTVRGCSCFLSTRAPHAGLPEKGGGIDYTLTFRSLQRAKSVLVSLFFSTDMFSALLSTRGEVVWSSNQNPCRTAVGVLRSPSKEFALTSRFEKHIFLSINSGTKTLFFKKFLSACVSLDFFSSLPH